MSRIACVLGVAFALAGAGCESVSDATSAVRGHMAVREQPRVRTVAALPRATYEAVRATATDMGYRFVRGGPAQGEFEAISGLRSGETIGSARQISMKVALQATLDGKGTDVSIWLKEIIETDSSNRAGQATETPLRDTPQYDVFFLRLERRLGLKP